VFEFARSFMAFGTFSARSFSPGRVGVIAGKEIIERAGGGI
jgi:hypothetical protein